MLKKRLLIVCLLVLALPILIYQFYSFRNSLIYKESIPPRNTADSLKNLVASLIRNGEGFAGSVHVSYIDPHHDGQWNKAQIKVLNTAVYDDSIGPIEYIAIAEKTGDVWKVTNYKDHWKCKRNIIFNFWTTSSCI